MRRAALTGAVALAVLAVDAGVALGQPGLRPTDPDAEPGYHGVPEARPVRGRSVVVHYVRRGPSAPPDVDVDRDRVPDYVEWTADAADQALAYYRSPRFCPPILEGRCATFRGFRAPRRDCAGPDRRPDVYLVALGPRTDATAPWARCRGGGSFVAISPRLVVGDGNLIHLVTTVGHEMFHLVQYAYAPPLSPWLREATANAATAQWTSELGIEDPEHDYTDPVLERRFGDWLAHVSQSLYSAYSECDPCYRGFVWWARLMSLDRRALPRLLQRLGAETRGSYPPPARRQLEIFTDVVGGQAALTAELTAFSQDLFRMEHARIERQPPWSPTRRPRRASIDGLALHYVPIALPPGATSLAFSVTLGPERVTTASLLLPSEPSPQNLTVTARAVAPSRSVALPGGRRRLLFSTTLVHPGEVAGATVLLANGGPEPVRYRLAG
ncbi:MAG TPA: hypothetical protein VFR97_03805 [Capillimicrobium sp.]|nr:hypothetical protein [Capillimicrobium sp.]